MKKWFDAGFLTISLKVRKDYEPVSAFAPIGTRTDCTFAAKYSATAAESKLNTPPIQLFSVDNSKPVVNDVLVSSLPVPLHVGSNQKSFIIENAVFPCAQCV